MSTNSYDSTPSSSVPSEINSQFVREVTQRFGPIRTGCARLLAESTPNVNPSLGPLDLRQVSHYSTSTSMARDGLMWKNHLGRGGRIAVWDVPVQVLSKQPRSSISWADHFRGEITSMQPTGSSNRSMPSAMRTDLVSSNQGISPYQDRVWFRVQRQVNDARHVALRKTYPRAYEHWSEDEKRELRVRIEHGDHHDQIAHDLRRQPEAVAAGIWKNAPAVAEAFGVPRPEHFGPEGHHIPTLPPPQEAMGLPPMTPVAATPAYHTPLPPTASLPVMASTNVVSRSSPAARKEAGRQEEDFAIVHDEDLNGIEVSLAADGSIQSVGQREQLNDFHPLDSIAAEDFAAPLRVVSEVRKMLKDRGIHTDQLPQVAALLNRGGR